MRPQISKFSPLRNWLSTNRDPFECSLFSTRGERGFQTFHSELSVVLAKRSLVTNKIDLKLSFSSNLTLGPSLAKKIKLNQKVIILL